jgi:hypothetical protein
MAVNITKAIKAALSESDCKDSAIDNPEEQHSQLDPVG